MIRLLSQLPSADPNAARAERIRKRCRARLVRRAAPPREVGTTPRLWQPLLMTLAAAYLTEAVLQALRLYRLP
jgi:hypothetical protein